MDSGLEITQSAYEQNLPLILSLSYSMNSVAGKSSAVVAFSSGGKAVAAICNVSVCADLICGFLGAGG